MKNKKCRTAGTVLKYIRKIVETEVKSISLTYKYITAHFCGLVPAFRYKVAGLS